jgi:hypothetical protein
VPLVYLLPPSVMAVLAFGGLAAWTGRYTAKAHAAHPRLEPETSS